MHGNTAYVIEPADGLEEPVILLYQRRPRLAVGSQPPIAGELDDGLDCSTIQTWPPPSRLPALMCDWGDSDGVPVELM